MSLFSKTDRLSFFERQLERSGVFPLAAGCIGAGVVWRIASESQAYIDRHGVDPAAITAISLLVGGGVIAMGAYFWKEIRRRGKFIVDCGPMPARAEMLGVAIGILTASSRTPKGLEALGIFLAAMPLFFLAMSCGRLRVYEQGLWLYFGLLEWSRIGRYEWSEDGTKLLLRGKKFEKWMKSEIPVDPYYRDVISRCLNAYVVPQEESIPSLSAAVAT